MPISPPTCRLCSEHHWSHEPHKYPKDLKPRTITADIKAQGVKPFKKPRTVKLKDGAADSLLAAMDRCSCGAALRQPKRGPAPKFCSDTCRKRASRKR